MFTFSRQVLVIVFGCMCLVNARFSTRRANEIFKTKKDHKLSEFRAVWLVTVGNTDWPPPEEHNSTIQKQTLIEYLDTMVEVNLNAVFFHIRPKSDAFYNSSIEPWTIYLSGTQGKPPNPYYDPLEFILKEASTRNIEVHAWLNPYIANSPATFDNLAPNHVAKRYPEYAYKYGPFLWMDPGAEEVSENLRKVVMDIIKRYPVHGIHFDDYYYPYPEKGAVFPDNATYTRYVDSGGNMSLGDWRRNNVNEMIRNVYNDIKSYNRKIKFTISPFGLYKPGEAGGMPDTIEGLDPYSEIYADAKLWLQSGWVDALIPQLYWAIDPPKQSYPVVLDWWLSVNNASRHIYAGNAAYRILPDESDWPVSELINQTDISRLHRNRERQSLGNVWFSAKYFKSNTKNVTSIFKKFLYQTPAKVPDMPWLHL